MRVVPNFQSLLSASPSANTATAKVFTLDELAARRATHAPSVAPQFTRAQLSGRLIELAAHGAGAGLTAATSLLRETQREGEPAAWLHLPGSSVYPPDLFTNGIDPQALVFVRAPDLGRLVRAAERLLRSGGLGLVVIDLTGASAGASAGATTTPELLSFAQQGRLSTLAQQHDAAVVCLTQRRITDPSLGSLVSLRLWAERQREGTAFTCRVRALKDKQRGPDWTATVPVRPPAGMR